MRKRFYLLYFITCLIVFVPLTLYFYLPSEKEIRGCMKTKMYNLDLCPTSKNYVPLKNISKYLQKSVIVTEDGSFFEHDGFDWESIQKNAKENFAQGQYRRGGSTISQQLAKNMFLSPEKTLFRKFLEMLITFRIEKYLSKKEILERYLNIVEFGKNIYGVRQAASTYFHKSPSELNVAESAYLAILLPSPVKYSRSFYQPEFSKFIKHRVRKTIDDLYRSQRITAEEYASALFDMAQLLKIEPELPDIPADPSDEERMDLEDDNSFF